MSALSERALAVALRQDGIREVPPNSNRGPDVEKYQACVGQPPGTYWCAAFTSWCCREAGGRETVDYPHTAWTPAIWSWAQRRGQMAWAEPGLVDTGLVAVPPGSLFLLYGRVGTEERVKHVGFVEAVAGGTVYTVEGNTNRAGSHEGGGVYRLERPLASIYRFVFYGAAEAGLAAGEQHGPPAA